MVAAFIIRDIPGSPILVQLVKPLDSRLLASPIENTLSRNSIHPMTSAAGPKPIYVGFRVLGKALKNYLGILAETGPVLGIRIAERFHQQFHLLGRLGVGAFRAYRVPG